MPPPTMTNSESMTFLTGIISRTCLSVEGGGIRFQNHVMQGETQLYGMLGAVQRAGIAVPAFIGYMTTWISPLSLSSLNTSSGQIWAQVPQAMHFSGSMTGGIAVFSCFSG